MKQFSIGSQDFEMLISNNAFYLDKTKQIYNLVNSKSRYYFFSRPRRFGKSLLLSVMKNIFLGKKELFKGLYIHDKWKFEEYPVIHISLAGYKKSMDVEEFIKEKGVVYIDDKEIKIGDYNTLDLGSILEQIKKQTGKQTVILIDEYDKPVLEYLGDIEKAEEIREFFAGFYAPIKDNDANLRLFFLSGLTKLMKMSVFSVINNLDDISIRGPYADLIGYTQEEVESNFEKEIREIAKEQNISYKDIIITLKEEYNGFNFGDKKKLLYNPRDINSFINKKQFGYYWADTGIPSGINEFIKENSVDIQKMFDKERNKELGVTETGLRVHNLYNLKPEILFFHAGYLTIREITEDKIIQGILQNEPNQIQEGIQILIYEILGTTPYDWLTNNPEGWLKTLVGTAIRMNNIYRWGETQGIIGRTDMHIPKGDTIYIVEVKVDGSTKECIKQIEEKYEKQYINIFKKIVKIGVNRNMKGKKVGVNCEL